jgi:preprotein translocase subunit SecA
MVSNSIERSQKKVEENNFGTRKHLLEYDDVMNIQREAIYKKRNNALFGERVGIDINNMFCDLADELVKIHHPMRDFVGFEWDVFEFFNIKSTITEAEFRSQKVAELSRRIQSEVWKSYKSRSLELATSVLPIIERVHENEGDKFVNIAIPYTDGKKQMQIIANMEDCLKDGAATLTTEIEKGTTLALIDTAWKEHLRNMDDLKESVRTASFEQKDPLVRYKIEAYAMFKALMGQINRDVVSFLSKGIVPILSEEDIQEAPEHIDEQEYFTNEELEAMREEEMRQRALAQQRQQNLQQRAPQAPIRHDIKIGRNDVCPCGSGKKYKNCHGK